MKASLASPGRKDGTFRDPVASVTAPALSTSLSVRRLKTSASVKGGQSPAMFSSVTSTSNRKKGGGGFEQAEPTSPKVTCIGQVRGKTSRKKEKKNKKKKKNGKKKKPTTSKKVILARSLSRRLAEAGGEGSFRGEEVGEGERPVCFRNQRWVHLHLGSICEAVKGALGSEISCFHPCGRSQCSTTKGKEKAGKTCSVKMGSCGASFARWLYTIHESEESEDEGEVLAIEEEEEKVVEVDLTKMRTTTRRGSRRELEIIADELEKGGTFGKLDNTSCKHEGDDDEEKVCVPPPNALLLMRCRSDPVRMAALQNRFWGSPVASKVKDTQEDGDEDKDTKVAQQNILKKREDTKSMGEAPAETKQEVTNTGIASQLQEVGNGDDTRIGSAGETRVDSSAWKKNPNGEEEEKTEEEEAPQPQDLKHNPRRKKKKEKKKNRNRKTTMRRDKNGRRHSFSAEREARKSSSFSEKEAKRRFSFSSSYMEPRRSSLYLESSERRRIRPVEADQMGSIDPQSGVKVEEQQEEQLPDCLLMMMYEPKLSMEVSKETWVCSSEFFRYRHLHQQRSSQSGVNLEAKEHMCAAEKEEKQEEEEQQQEQEHEEQEERQEEEQEEEEDQEEEEKDPSVFMDGEPRLESKLKAEPPSAPPESKSGPTFGPFVLTRCKSDPVRASAKISPEFCFWRARHQPAAGVGF